MAVSYKMIRDNMRIGDVETKICNQQQYIVMIARKLMEESAEIHQVAILHGDFISDADRRKRFVEEMGDLSEAIECMLYRLKIKHEEVVGAARRKRHAVGSFRLGRLLPFEHKSNEQMLCELVQDLLGVLGNAVDLAVDRETMRTFTERANKLGAMEETS